MNNATATPVTAKAEVKPTPPTPVVTEAVTPKGRKSKHPIVFDFTGVGDLTTLTILRAGKQKKPAKQLMEILKFAKDSRITKMSLQDFLAKMDKVREQTDDNKAKYPQLCGSVQTMTAVVNHYWSVGQLALAGVKPGS